MPSDYYNLLMSGNEDAWTGTSWAMDRSRIFEHTDYSVKERFASLDDNALSLLMGLPTLFAYEKGVETPARVGRITEITRRQSGREFALTFSIDSAVAPIPPEKFSSLLRELNIERKLEVHRTHWAVKNVDLGRVLHEAGLTNGAVLAPQAPPPRVFISYSWDTPEHRTWVAQLATALRRDGIDVILDQWHLGLGEELSAFMIKAVRDSDRVLMICTEQYVSKADGRQGGVGYEQMLVSSFILRDVGTSKFIPIVRRNAAGSAFVPQDLAGRKYLDLTDGAHSKDAYRELVRELHNIPVALPPLGLRPTSF
ncbi:toll/interleukin-1 receptor domain-containing protein [Burkholderia cepacia]|uniref:toll/interleukin-1 receptor domain-containing protein n=1 Tax=Burkholderia cepacia TaxID=292 RepID=UPI001CF5D42C|nr:toll/interleukin-1 receptor domain-containing protein [Burkholderia cepacia]MCA8323800.1 toll/interleukin-1 receptor domain-containing protein [Burkholderia cepacia]